MTAYEIIAAYYGDRTANRSGVKLIRHIDEGLIVLREIGASQTTKEAYCLHPIVQSDEALHGMFHGGAHALSSSIHSMLPRLTNYRTMILAMEYRRVANSYLSRDRREDLVYSPLPEVYSMLIADKVQNFKDFELYHAATHPRREELAQYFRNWLDILGITEDKYQEYKKLIS